MADFYNIDSHKLHLHPRRVADWLEGKAVAPIYMEISPTGACNLRCSFCALDFMGYAHRELDADLLAIRFREMSRTGLKSVMFAGEGEPFLHPRIADITRSAHDAGLDCAFTSNGTRMERDILENILPITSWIKVSCNAGTQSTYANIHGVKGEMLDRVWENLETAVALRKDKGWKCTLGMQALLLPDNAAEMAGMARRCRDIGLDYFVVKPYSQHPQSLTSLFADIEYPDSSELARELEEFRTDGFSPVVRLHTMDKWQERAKPYERCLALPFWSYLDAGGNIWGCSVFLNDERFLYGNIAEQTFQEIWHGEKRRQSLEWVSQSMEPSNCRVNCRMDEINRYLWNLEHPGAHANFI